MSPYRAYAAIASFLAASFTASAQVAIAPPPHPTLEHIAQEYERFKLPLPKANWRLVRTGAQPIAFLSRDSSSTLLIGTTQQYNEERVEDLDLKALVVRLRDDSATFRRQFTLRPGQLTCLAVQCRHVGQKELAQSLYAIAVDLHRSSRIGAVIRDGKTGTERIDQPLDVELCEVAFEYWWGRAQEHDRRTALEMLQVLAPDFGGTKDLAMTLAPSKSRPGTPEAFIDRLTEYAANQEDDREFPAIERLIEFGFDAVPALIAHCRDRRFTLAHSAWINNFRSYPIRVGHLCSQILDGLLGSELGVWELRGDMADPGEALKAYGRALLVGEERWLAEKSLPMLRRHSEFLEPGDDPVLAGEPNRIALRALAARFPNRIAPIYQTILYKRSDVESDLIAELVGASRLARSEKLQLLEEAARHPDLRHRLPALRALQSLDRRIFHKHLLAALKSMGTGSGLTDFSRSPEARIAEVVTATDDRECWDAFIAASKHAVPSLRIAHVSLIHQNWKPQPPNEPRLEKLRYLREFLTDSEHQGSVVADANGNPIRYQFGESQWSIGEVAANQIGDMTKLPIPALLNVKTPTSMHSLLYRVRAGIAAEREMERLLKR